MAHYDWKKLQDDLDEMQQKVERRFDYFYGDFYLNNRPQPPINITSATDADIEELEARLGCTLPPSYRHALQNTGGWSPANSAKIDWYARKNPTEFQKWLESEQRHGPALFEAATAPYGQMYRLPADQKHLVGATLDLGNGYLLKPAVVSAEGEWEAWDFDPETRLITKYPSYWESQKANTDQYIEWASALFLKPQPQTDPLTGQVTLKYDWQTFLRLWSKILVRPDKAHEVLRVEDEYDEYFTKEAHESGWVGYPPATETEIVETETRLGIKFPPSYRQFLQITNGFPFHQGLLMTVLPVDEIKQFENWSEEDFIELYESILGKDWREKAPPDEIYFNYATQDHYPIRLEHTKFCIKVGDFDGNDFYVLNPCVLNKYGEWEAWLIYHEGELQRYPSFWEMMQEAYYRTMLL